MTNSNISITIINNGRYNSCSADKVDCIGRKLPLCTPYLFVLKTRLIFIALFYETDDGRIIDYKPIENPPLR